MGLAGWWHNAVCPTVVGLWVGTAAGQPSRASVYRASIDAEAVARWKVPTGMTCRVHRFDGRAGGTFRETSAHTDTYHGRFVALVPDELVVEVDEFETADQATAAT